MAKTTWPDGEPRRGPNDNGSVGGVAPDGHALRHSDGWESPPSLGWLTPATALSPRWTPIGPGSAPWNSRKAARTLGQAAGGKPPKGKSAR